MDTDTKLLLDEVQQRISGELAKLLADRDAKWEQSLVELERHSDERVTPLESAAKAFDEWRPRIEVAVDNVKLEIGKLARHWERSMRDRSTAEPGLFPNPKSATERPPAPDPHADGPIGHRVDRHNRDDGFGSVLIQTHVPVKGMSGFSPPHSQFPHSHEPPGHHWGNSSHHGNSMGKFPRLPFLVFTGDNPKLWLPRCENYFEMYNLDPVMWIPVATMPFDDAAARWFESVEQKLKKCFLV